MPKKNNKNLEKIFISKISRVPNVSVNDLLKDDFTKIEGYDSLKHLIITEIDKVYGKIKKIGDLSKFTSVKKIIKQLNK